MKVLVLSDLWVPFPGGAERLLFNLARHLGRRGLDVVVVTGYEAAQRFDGPPIELIAAPDGDDDWMVGAEKIRRVVDRHMPDVIVTHHWWLRRFEPMFSRLAEQVPIVQVVLNGHRLPQAALAVFIADYVRDQAEPEPDDLTILPPAFPEDVVADEHGDAVGFVKPIAHKGVELFWRIAAAQPRRRFVVLRGEWQEIEVLRPARNVTLMEPVDDIREFWREVRMVLVPSLSEDAGTVAQEAALNRVPCLSSAVGGLLETNRGGVLLEPNDLRGWLAAIRQLDNPARYREVVDRQLRTLESYGHAARLDVFAERVTELG